MPSKKKISSQRRVEQEMKEDPRKLDSILRESQALLDEDHLLTDQERKQVRQLRSLRFTDRPSYDRERVLRGYMAKKALERGDIEEYRKQRALSGLVKQGRRTTNKIASSASAEKAKRSALQAKLESGSKMARTLADEASAIATNIGRDVALEEKAERFTRDILDDALIDVRDEEGEKFREMKMSEAKYVDDEDEYLDEEEEKFREMKMSEAKYVDDEDERKQKRDMIDYLLLRDDLRDDYDIDDFRRMSIDELKSLPKSPYLIDQPVYESKTERQAIAKEAPSETKSKGISQQGDSESDIQPGAMKVRLLTRANTRGPKNPRPAGDQVDDTKNESDIQPGAMKVRLLTRANTRGPKNPLPIYRRRSPPITNRRFSVYDINSSESESDFEPMRRRNRFGTTRFMDAEPINIRLNDNQIRQPSQINPDTYRTGFISDSKQSDDALLRDQYKIDPNFVMDFSESDQNVVEQSAMIADRDDVERVYNDVDEVEILTGGVRDSLFDTLDVHKVTMDSGLGDASSAFTRGQRAQRIQEVDLENIGQIADRDASEEGGLNVKAGGHQYPSFGFGSSSDDAKYSEGWRDRINNEVQPTPLQDALSTADNIIGEISNLASLADKKDGTWFSKDTSIESDRDFEERLSDDKSNMLPLNRNFQPSNIVSEDGGGFDNSGKNSGMGGRGRINPNVMGGNSLLMRSKARLAGIDSGSINLDSIRNKRIDYKQPNRRRRGNQVDLVRLGNQTHLKQINEYAP